MDVVDGEESWDAEAFCGGWDKACHPIVTVDEIGGDFWDDVVDDLTLEGEGGVKIGSFVVDFLFVVEDAVFGQMDSLFGKSVFDASDGAVEQHFDVDIEHFPVIGERDVDVGTLFVERVDKRRGDIRHAAGFGAHALGEVSHARREVSDFGSDDENAFSALAVGVVYDGDIAVLIFWRV